MSQSFAEKAVDLQHLLARFDVIGVLCYPGEVSDGSL